MFANFFDNPLFEISYFNNTLFDYFLFFIILFVIVVGFFIFKLIVLRKLAKKIGRNNLLQLPIDIIDKIRSPFYIYVGFYIALFALVVPPILSKLFFVFLILLVAYRVVVAASQVIDFFASTYIDTKEEIERKAMLKTLSNIAKALLWLFALLVVLSIFGVNVTAIIAGMGVGGIAIAFALQNILSDLFSSFSIYFDRPFIEGDLIVVGDKWGNVEKIGMKSTRIRSLQGEEIIFSNKELTSVQIHNYRRMKKRRSEFKIGVTYDTSTQKLKKIPSMIEKIVAKEELTDFSRAHFTGFGDFSLDFIVVYFVESPNYQIFMDINEKVLLAIKKAFEKEKIEFAYPTQDIYLTKR